MRRRVARDARAENIMRPTKEASIGQYLRILRDMRSGLVVGTDRFIAINDAYNIAKATLTEGSQEVGVDELKRGDVLDQGVFHHHEEGTNERTVILRLDDGTCYVESKKARVRVWSS